MAKKVKQDVIEFVRQKFGITEAEAEAYVEATVEGITNLVTAGHELHIKNFARWKTVEVAGREHHNPSQPGQKVWKPAHQKITCKNLIDPEK